MDPRKPDVVTVAVTRVDGGVTILRIVVREYRPATRAEVEGGSGPRVLVREVEPTEQYVESLLAQYVGAGLPLDQRQWVGGQLPISWRFVPNDYVPEEMAKSDRYFRGAWKDDGGNTPAVDMPKAREIHRQHLRRMRAPLLEQLDTDYLRASEPGYIGRSAGDIAKAKQALRDVTADPRIDAAQTPDELKAVIPEALRG